MFDVTCSLLIVLLGFLFVCFLGTCVTTGENNQRL